MLFNSSLYETIWCPMQNRNDATGRIGRFNSLILRTFCHICFSLQFDCSQSCRLWGASLPEMCGISKIFLKNIQSHLQRRRIKCGNGERESETGLRVWILIYLLLSMLEVKARPGKGWGKSLSLKNRVGESYQNHSCGVYANKGLTVYLNFCVDSAGVVHLFTAIC